MIDDEKIIEMFFERSEQGIRELDIKYGKVCHNLSYHIVGSRRDVILSILVDTFFSKISLTMLLTPKPHNTVFVLS